MNIYDDKYNVQNNSIGNDNISIERLERARNFYEELAKRENENQKKIRNNASKKKMHLTAKGKRAIKNSIVIAGALTTGVCLTIAGNKIIVEKKYQKNIDNYVESKLENKIEIPANISMEETQRKELTEYLTAVQTYLDDDKTWQERNSAENVIVSYTDSGKAISASKSVLSAQVENAKKYGDYKEIGDLSSSSKEKVIYIDDQNVEGFHISGVTGKTYSTSSLSLFNKSIPKDLRKLTEDILDERKSYKNKEDCLEDGLKIGEDLGKVVYEFYLLDNKGNLKRVNEKDYNNKKEIYDKQQQEKQDKIGEAIAEKYGITDQMSNKSTNYYER